MLSLLKTEYLKLRGYKPFWLTLAGFPLAVGTLVMLALKSYQWAHTRQPGLDVALAGSPFQFPLVWQSVTFSAGWCHALPAVLLILSITNEFQFRTHRQNLLDGWSRGRFFLAKAGSGVLLALACTLCVALIAIAVGVSQGSFANGGFEFLACYFLQACVYLTLALTAGFLCQKGLNAMIVFLAYTTLGEKLLTGVALYCHAGELSKYFPINTANALIQFPASRMVTTSLPLQLLEVPTLAVVSLAWIAALAAIAWSRFRHQDL